MWFHDRPTAQTPAFPREATDVAIHEVVSIVSAKLFDRLRHLGGSFGDEVGPDAAIVEFHPRWEGTVGVARVAAVNHEVGLLIQHRLIGQHTAAIGIDPKALARRIA